LCPFFVWKCIRCKSHENYIAYRYVPTRGWTAWGQCETAAVRPQFSRIKALIVFVSLELPVEGLVSSGYSRLSQLETVSTFENSSRVSPLYPLQLRLWRGQLPSSHEIGESGGLCASHHKRACLAECPQRQRPIVVRPAKPKGLSLGIKRSQSRLLLG